MAIWARAPDLAGLVHHSDRGVQYLSIRYTERLAEVAAVGSVGSKGDCWANAAAESVNGLYKADPRGLRLPAAGRVRGCLPCPEGCDPRRPIPTVRVSTKASTVHSQAAPRGPTRLVTAVAKRAARCVRGSRSGRTLVSRSARGRPSAHAAQPTRSGRGPKRTTTRSGRGRAGRKPPSVRRPPAVPGWSAADGATSPRTRPGPAPATG